MITCIAWQWWYPKIIISIIWTYPLINLANPKFFFLPLSFELYQFSSVAQSCPTLCSPMDCSTPGFPVRHQLLELAQTEVHWVGDAFQPPHPLSFPSPPVFNLSQHQDLFQWVSSLYQVAKVLELQLQHQPFNEYSGLISFRMDWFDLLAIQGTLKSLLQHHSSKASVLWHSAFFMVQRPYGLFLCENMYGLTFIHDYWKNQSFDQMDLCQQSNVSAF